MAILACPIKLARWGRRGRGVRLGAAALWAVVAVGLVGCAPDPDPMLVTVGHNPVAYSPIHGAAPRPAADGPVSKDSAEPAPVIVPAYTAPVYGRVGPAAPGP